MTIRSIVYISQEKYHFKKENFLSLLQSARNRNNHYKITGLLIYNAGLFCQIFEGPPIAVDTIYQIICADPHHKILDVLRDERIDERVFDNWEMGFKNLSSNGLTSSNMPTINNELKQTFKLSEENKLIAMMLYNLLKNLKTNHY